MHKELMLVLTNQSLKDALHIVGQYKHELHNKMLSCNIENLEALRKTIDEFTRLENRINTELKSGNGKYLSELNKDL